MVKGLDVFKQYFEDYPENYVIIGGTACDIIIEESGLVPRTTKDIDIILIVEALSSEFVIQFWNFIHDGNYQQREKSDGKREYYRFIKPEHSEFPYQIELFSRTPDLIVLEGESYLTPIPVGDDLSSLSAILLNDEYYHYMISNSRIADGIRYANTEALICLKAKAYLEIRDRIEKGSKEDSKQLRKHKSDVFRLTTMLTPESEFHLPESIFSHISQFASIISDDLPDKSIFKEMGLNRTEPKDVFELFRKSFKLT
jgi:hypothetical protein